MKATPKTFSMAVLLAAALLGCGTRGGAGIPTDAPVGSSASCGADSDCRLVDDYCTGCDCRALATAQPDPTCSGPGVRCLVAPCAGKAATCKSGHCAIASD